MKVLVTGASGFLGSHIADELTGNGHDVTLFDLKDSPFRMPVQKMVTGNLLDTGLLDELTNNTDCVFHFAAVADVNAASLSPYNTININIMGTVNLIEACLRNKVKRFMYASSMYAYSNKGGFYSATKKSCEILIENYAAFSDIKFTILRYGSLYGGRCGRENGMFRLVDDLLNAKDTFVYSGTGEEIREYINVLDAAKLSVQCMADEYSGRILILTGMQKFKMKDIILLVSEILGKNIKIEFSGKVNELHYEITPYRYIPKLGEKIVNNPHIDLGQGILNLIESIHSKQIC